MVKKKTTENKFILYINPFIFLFFMKKTLYFAAALVSALASCSSDDDMQNNQAFVDNSNNGMVPVELGLSNGSVNVFQTRGTGTVGDTALATNVFQNEDLYVLMTTIPDSKSGLQWTFTSIGDEGDAKEPQFDGSFISRPEKSEDKWVINYTDFTGHKVKYYPIDGEIRSDFFAFYIDDAATNLTAGNPVISDSVGRDVKYVEFKIDGSQDIMTGKAEKNDGDYTTFPYRGYSARSARKGIKPEIPMQHMLTRFTFGLLPRQKEALGLIIDTLYIYSRSEGVLTVAYNQDGTKVPNELVRWTQDPTTPMDSFALKVIPAPYTPSSRIDAAGNKVKLVIPETLAEITKDQIYAKDPTSGSYDETTTVFSELFIGDALFVQPNQKEYIIKLVYRYPYESGTGIAYHRLPATHVVAMKDGTPFEVGKSYHVQIYLYGLNEIGLNVSLTPWGIGNDGKPIPVNADPSEQSLGN